MNTPEKVLILGDDYRMVLPIVRSLGRKGIEVHLAWCPDESPAIQSRFTQRRHELPWYSTSDQQWIAALDALVDREQFTMVIPATEHVVYALQTARDQLRNSECVYLLDDRAFQAVVDKQATYALCEKLLVSYPKTVQVDEVAALDELADELGLPLIVKPHCSVSTEATLGKDYVRRCHTLADAREYVGYLLERGTRVALQQHCPGEGVGVELLAHEGEILTALQHRRLHETTGHGSTYRETVPLDEQLLSACRALMANLNYTGVAMVEFRVDPATGAWWLIEINGRFWGSLPLAAAAGIDFPGQLFEMLVEERTSFPATYKAGVRSRALTNDIRWLWRRITGCGKSFDSDQTQSLGWVANDVAFSSVLLHTLRGAIGIDHIDAFARDDMRPALAELATLLADATCSLRRRFARLMRPHFSGINSRQTSLSSPRT